MRFAFALCAAALVFSPLAQAAEGLPKTWIGAWSFQGDEACDHGNLLHLRADGTVSMQEGFSGTWIASQDGRLVMIMQATPDEPEVPAGEPILFEWPNVKITKYGLEFSGGKGKTEKLRRCRKN